MKRYSVFAIAREASATTWAGNAPGLAGTETRLDVVIVRGRAMVACTLAELRHHQCRDHRGWLGGGNISRNTTIIRSNICRTLGRDHERPVAV